MLEILKRWWNKPGDELDAALRSAVAAEREACAKVCDAEAESMEQGAQRAIENGERDEVSAIRSAAWKLSVAANRIRARSNAALTGAEGVRVEGTVMQQEEKHG